MSNRPNVHKASRRRWNPFDVMLGVTLETNRDEGHGKISEGSAPSRRYHDFAGLDHPVRMATFEPVLDFDLNTVISWFEDLNPWLIWPGYDTRNNHLPELPIGKVKALHWELSSRGSTVALKTVRKAWWEG